MSTRSNRGTTGRDVVDRIAAFNRDRDVDTLALKYKAMRHDAFAFMRGTCHLFYEDWPKRSPLNNAPLVWLCGDLHPENFGTYKADNRLVYYDLADFDESALGPCTWDLARFLTSLLVAARELRLKNKAARLLGETFLDAYTLALHDGKARWVERATAKGMVRELLESLVGRQRRTFLDERTNPKGDRRRLRLDGKRTLPIEPAKRRRVERFMRHFAETQPDPRFFRVLDVARRIAGTGSLGLERYVVLVRGRGSPNGNFLLDLKYQPGSALGPFLSTPQPRWANEAERVVAVQRRVQAIAPALLHAGMIGPRAYVLKELMPTEDKLRLATWGGKLSRLQRAVAEMGLLVAWGQLRSSGRDGSATADELIAFASGTRWRRQVLDYVLAYRKTAIKGWREFRAGPASST